MATLAVGIAFADPATAQTGNPPARPPFAVGASAGWVSTSDENSSVGHPLTAFVEWTVAPNWALRGQYAFERWTVLAHGINETFEEARVGLSSFSVGFTRQLPHARMEYIPPYVSVGIGLYHFGFDRYRNLNAWRPGVYGAVGVQVPRAARHALRFELQWHVVDGPKHTPISAYWLDVISFQIGFKFAP